MPRLKVYDLATTRYGYVEKNAAGELANTGTGLIYLAAGDNVRVQVFHNSGATVMYTDIGPVYSQFSGVLIR